MQLAAASVRTGRRELWTSAQPAALVAALGLIAFAWLCAAAGGGSHITAADGSVATWFASHRTAGEGEVALVVARVTSPAVLIAVVVAASAWLWLRQRRFEAALLAGSVALAYLVGAVVKLLEHRARPAAPVNLAPEAESSFPSGHVLVVATIAVVALLLAWSGLQRRGRLFAAVAAVTAIVGIAADRLVAGAHWVTDVAASLALAAVVCSFALLLVRLRHRHAEE